jgi:hypothetical protein
VNEAFVSVFHFRDNDFDGFADVNADDRDTAEFPNCQVFDGCTVSFPRGWSPNRTDCDDSNPNVHPDGNRFCRINDTCELTGTAPLDNNCNGVFDEFDVIDVDGDGFANATASANATRAASCARRRLPTVATATIACARSIRTRPSSATASTTTANC